MAHFVSLVALVTAAAAFQAEGSRPMEGVDPNSVSCDPEGQIFLLLPHHSDCSKFYICAHGEEKEFDCSGNTIFDFAQQGCDWKDSAVCVLRNPKEEEEEGSGSGEDLIGNFGEENKSLAKLRAVDSRRPISAVAAQKFNGVLNCNRADSASRQIPYKNDCQRYWKCVAGVPQVFYCSDGLFFNESKEQCDFEANARCSIVPEEELQGEFIVYE